MRFNEKELKFLALQHKCEKEGNLYLRELNEGFFRRTEINNLKWCKLHGNLLFYFKTNDQFADPTGVIICENVKRIVKLDNDSSSCAFLIEFADGQTQYFEAENEAERNEWVDILTKANYNSLRERLTFLRKRVETKRGMAMQSDVDIETNRLESSCLDCNDESEMWVAKVSCNKLTCDGNGKPPNPLVIVQIRDQLSKRWINYCKTEMVERSSSADFFTSVLFRKIDGINNKSFIRISVYDVREKISQISVPIGFAELELCNLIRVKHQKISLRLKNQIVGSVTLVIQNEFFKNSDNFLFHGMKCENQNFFINPIIRTYNFESELGQDITMFDVMMESHLNFIIPQQLLSIWISREKELIKEISGIGELDSLWCQKQLKLLDVHLKLLKNYSQAKKSIQNFMCLDRRSFKPSIRKTEETLEFMPVNLHLQRMNVSSEFSSNRTFDVITVGAFTYSGKTKNGGLMKLLHQLKDSPSTLEQTQHKIQVANDCVQSIKQLRKEVVNLMCKLISLAGSKTIDKMLKLCQMIVEKTRSLVTILEPSLVATAFKFIEEHRVAIESVKTEIQIEKVTKTISELTSPEIEDILHATLNNFDNEEKGKGEFYQPTEEPEPLELIQLNLEASVMCLVSKVKIHCGRIGSPAVRIRQPLNQISIAKYGSPTSDEFYSSKEKDEFSTKFETLINLKSNNELIEELRPAMKKLSQAMDGMLKTARLVHSVHRLHQDMKKMTSNMSIIYHRDVCFSQALTALVTGLVARFWSNQVDKFFIDTIIHSIGPLAYFEGYLSLYGQELDFWSDMNVAVEDLAAVNFTLTSHSSESEPVPKISGSRQALFVNIPVPENVYEMLSESKKSESFKVCCVFFNIGINEKATLAETLGYCKEQFRSNTDNFEKLKIYFMQYKKLKCYDDDFQARNEKIQQNLHKLDYELKSNTQKNVDILFYAQDVTRLSNGLRFTSCKSAKDRTGMAVTLEQTKILHKDYQLSKLKLQSFLNVLRTGTRLENTKKNIGKRMYAFSVPQMLALPQLYRPPTSTYGKTKS